MYINSDIKVWILLLGSILFGLFAIIIIIRGSRHYYRYNKRNSFKDLQKVQLISPLNLKELIVRLKAKQQNDIFDYNILEEESIYLIVYKSHKPNFPSGEVKYRIKFIEENLKNTIIEVSLIEYHNYFSARHYTFDLCEFLNKKIKAEVKQ